MRFQSLIIAAAGLVLVGVPAANYAMNPPHAALSVRTYALVLELEQGGERHAYVMDHGLSLSDCWQSAMDNKSNAKMACEREF